jgi:hypothetical protein
MFGECLVLLNAGVQDAVINKLALLKTQNQNKFNRLITQNDYELFNRAMHLGSQNVMAYILSAYDDHLALVSSKQFKILSSLIDDQRFDILNLLFCHINSDCRDMLFTKFGEFQMSLCCVQANRMEFYRESQAFSYSQFSEIIKAAIKTNSNTRWLKLYFRRPGHSWTDADLLDCLRIAIRVGNIDAVKLIETLKSNICHELLRPEHTYAFVEAARHPNIFYHLTNQVFPYYLEQVFSANEYAWLHEAVAVSNNSDILSTVLGFFNAPSSRTLAITSGDNALYKIAYYKENRDMMEVLLADQTIFKYAMKDYKIPKYEDTLPTTPHLKRLLLESYICCGKREISEPNLKTLVQSFSLEEKREYFKLALEHRHIDAMNLLYASIQKDASEILFSQIKQEILACRRLSLIKFLMQWSQNTVLDLLKSELPEFFNFSISKNWTELLEFLNQNFPSQFQDTFKDFNYWQKVVANFSVDVFKLLFNIMAIGDIELILRQDNYRLFYCILEKSLATTNQWNYLNMLDKVMSEFPLLRREMVTSNPCVSIAIQARNAVAVRNLLHDDKTIFFAVVRQLFQLAKKDEICLLLDLFHSDSYCRDLAQIDPQYRDEYKMMLNKFSKFSRKRPKYDDFPLQLTSAQP